MSTDGSSYEEETYSKGLNREDTLEHQIRIITNNYNNGKLAEFEWSIKALLPLLPKKIRVQFTPLPHDTSEECVEQHYQMFLNIQIKLEDDTNMVWNKKFIKTFE